jgi:hypothetical protein
MTIVSYRHSDNADGDTRRNGPNPPCPVRAGTRSRVV